MTVPATEPLGAYTLTLNQAATLLDVSTKTVQRAVKAGRLSCVRVPARRGHELRFRPEEVRALVPAAPPPPLPSGRPAPVPSPSPAAPDDPAPAPSVPREKGPSSRDKKRAAPGPRVTKRAQIDQVTTAVGAVDVRLERMEERMTTMIEQHEEVRQGLVEMYGLPRRLDDHEQRLAALAAEAATYRERVAWLEGLLSDAGRELSVLRSQVLPPPQAALPPQTEEAPQDVAPAPAAPPPSAATPSTPPRRRAWWRRLVGR